MLKNLLKIAKEHATSKGGDCLSTQYKNSHSKFEWKCHNPEHSSWHTRYSHVIHGGSWCPQCTYDKLKNIDGLKKAKEYAINKKGTCLSKQYKNARTKLEWKCHNKDHPSWFSNSGTMLGKKNWCPECKKESSSIRQRNPKGLLIAKEFAQTKKGLCLSNEYLNSKTKLEWSCDKKHHFYKSYEHVICRGQWCPECYKENKK